MVYGTLVIQTHMIPWLGQVRYVVVDHEPWMFGSDIATILGCSNPHRAVEKYVDKYDKRVMVRKVLHKEHKIVMINESGFHQLSAVIYSPFLREIRYDIVHNLLPMARRLSYKVHDTKLI